MKTFKTLACAVLAAAAMMSASAMAADKYVIACDAAYAPFSWENEEGKYVGIDVELLDAIAQAEGFEYELKPMNFDAVIPGVASGQLDGAIAGMNINPERQKVMDFSDPYYDSGLSVIVREDSTVTSLEELRGKTAAVKKGTTGSQFVEDNADEYDLKITYFASSPETMLAVKNGNAEFLLEDLPVISYQIKIGAQKGLKVAIPRVSGTPHYGFDVKKGQNQELLQQFNAGLQKLRDNGTYDKIVGQYQ